MKCKIIAIIFLFNFTSFLALNAQWARTYGGSEDDYANCIQQTSDGGFIVIGITESFGDHYLDFWVLKLASDGEIEWQKAYGGGAWNRAYSIQQTNDGGYIIGGSMSVGSLSYQFEIIKLLPDGNVEWQKNYGDYSFDRANIIQQVRDGGYIVAGYHYLSDLYMNDILILKLSINGTVEWSKTYGRSEDDQPNSILQTDEGGYIVVGKTISFEAEDYDAWILKLASDGEIEWQKSYGGSQGGSAYSIQQTNDGGYIVVGNILSFGANPSDFWTLKLSSEGDIEWNKTYGGSKGETAYSIQQTFDGGFIVAGETSSFGVGKNDILLLKLNLWGDIEWQKTYGGSKDEEASSIQQTYDGGYIVAGSTDTYGAGMRDFLILKLFSDGEMASTCTFVNDSNAEVSDIEVIPVDTYIDAKHFENLSEEIDITPKNSKAIVYSLCVGQHSLSITASSGGTTVPQPGIYMYNHAERIDIKANPDIGYRFNEWLGDFSDSDVSISITMDSDKSIQANFELNVLDEIWERVKRTPCFIATAAYDSPHHPHVQALKDFRDKYLLASKLGRWLVNRYYKYSPRIADIITIHKALRLVLRVWLLPVIALGSSVGHLGPVITTLILVLTLMAPFFFVWFYRRKSRLV